MLTRQKQAVKRHIKRITSGKRSGVRVETDRDSGFWSGAGVWEYVSSAQREVCTTPPCVCNNNNNDNNYTFPVRRLGVFRDDLMITRCVCVCGSHKKPQQPQYRGLRLVYGLGCNAVVLLNEKYCHVICRSVG